VQLKKKIMNKKLFAVIGIAGAITTFIIFKVRQRRLAQLKGTAARQIFQLTGFRGDFLKAELLTAIELALKCGLAVRECDASRREASFKDGTDGIDPVTKTDQDNEDLVTSTIQHRFPGHAIIGEEASAASGKIVSTLGDLSHPPTWIVDPIDGTQNFVHGMPLSCVSIGLCMGGRPVLGVVYEPFRDELFLALEGQGAYLVSLELSTARRLFVDGVRTLQKALVLTDPGYERSEEGVSKMTSAYATLLRERVQALRVIGSTVLSICWVACGRASAFVIGFHKEGGKSWDYAAAYVIAKESGASFTTIQTTTAESKPATNETATSFDIFGSSCICAGTTSLSNQIRSLVTR